MIKTFLVWLLKEIINAEKIELPGNEKGRTLPYLHLHSVAKSPITLDVCLKSVILIAILQKPAYQSASSGELSIVEAQDGWLTAGTQSFILTELSLVINSPSPLLLAAANFQLNAQLPISFQLFLIKATHKFPSRNLHGKKGNPFTHNQISRVNCLNHTCLAVL